MPGWYNERVNQYQYPRNVEVHINSDVAVYIWVDTVISESKLGLILHIIIFKMLCRVGKGKKPRLKQESL